MPAVSLFLTTFADGTRNVHAQHGRTHGCTHTLLSDPEPQPPAQVSYNHAVGAGVPGLRPCVLRGAPETGGTRVLRAASARAAAQLRSRGRACDICDGMVSPGPHIAGKFSLLPSSRGASRASTPRRPQFRADHRGSRCGRRAAVTRSRRPDCWLSVAARHHQEHAPSARPARSVRSAPWQGHQIGAQQ